MRVTLGVALASGLLACTAGSWAAAPVLEGRWEGQVPIPGAPMPVVLDLAPAAGVGWVASLTLPGRGVKGATLVPRVSGEGLLLSLESAFPIPEEPAPSLSLRSQRGNLVGEWRQAGHRAALVLRRSGPAQVDAAPSSTPISDALVGTWQGRYELGGYPREVTLTLGRNDRGLGTADLVIVGKRRNELPVDLVVQGEQFLSLSASAAGIRIEGRWRTASGDIEGELQQGPFEAALLLKRAPAGSKP